MPTILEPAGHPGAQYRGREGAEYLYCERTEGGEKGEENADEPEHAFLCMMPGMPELVAPYRKLGLDPGLWLERNPNQNPYIYH